MAEHSFIAKVTDGFAKRCAERVKHDFQHVKTTDLQQCCNKFEERYVLHLNIDDSGLVSQASLRRVISYFSTNKDLRQIQYDILELVLRTAKAEAGIDSPELPKLITLKKDLPVLTPTDFVYSAGASYLFPSLESEVPSGADEPLLVIGRLALWLVLKEGVVVQKTVEQMLSPAKQGWYQIDDCLYFQDDQTMVMVSAQTRLWLYQYWLLNDGAKPTLALSIRHYLQRRGLPLSFGHFRKLTRLAKIEWGLTQGPVFKEIKAGTLTSESLLPHTWYRLITSRRCSSADSRIEPEVVANQKETRRWQRVQRRSAQQADITLNRQLSIFDTVVNTAIKLAPKRQKKGIKAALRQWLEDDTYAEQAPWLWLMISWVVHLLDKGNVKSRLKLQTIKTYSNAVLNPFLTEFADAIPSKMTDGLWADKLNVVIDAIPVTRHKQYVHYFARYLVASSIVGQDVLEELCVSSVTTKVDTNLVTPREVMVIAEHLARQAGEVHEIARLALSFAFYSGLRRNEIRGLQLRDIQCWQRQCIVYVRSNEQRDLKSPASRRALPLHVLWPDDLRASLQQYLERREKIGAKSSERLFPQPYLTDKSLMLVTSLLKDITGDGTLRFHHLRHAFANWVWLALHRKQLQSIPDWLSYAALHYVDVEWSDQLAESLGLRYYSRKRLLVLSELLGHNSHHTTMASYIHINALMTHLFTTVAPGIEAIQGVFGRESIYRVNNNGEWGSDDIMSELTLRPPNVRLEKPCSLTVLKPAQSKEISLKAVWQILRLYTANKLAMDIAADLGLHPDVVMAILRRADQFEQMRRGKSKRNLKILAKGKLNGPEIRIVEFFIKQFELHQASFDKLWQEAALLVHQMTPAKDWLIRTDKIRQIRAMIVMLTQLGLKQTYFRLHWYLPRHTGVDQQSARKRLEKTNKALVSYFENCVSPTSIHRYVTKDFSHRKQWFQNVTVSDDGTFLKDTPLGHVALFVVRRQSDRTSRGNKRVFINPRRSKVIPLFLQLIYLWDQHNTQAPLDE
uniref:tyrosine-type recombinase/integrase n=1 Tax=Thaumasiovibrio occultus TaxID=1891184 RepID=UPI000B35527E|nr:tyrosine-type recombinase/integrase [Thaumasiovibrio occultus]